MKQLTLSLLGAFVLSAIAAIVPLRGSKVQGKEPVQTKRLLGRAGATRGPRLEAEPVERLWGSVPLPVGLRFKGKVLQVSGVQLDTYSRGEKRLTYYYTCPRSNTPFRTAA
jgi:hypothetical protein